VFNSLAALFNIVNPGNIGPQGDSNSNKSDGSGIPFEAYLPRDVELHKPVDLNPAVQSHSKDYPAKQNTQAADTSPLRNIFGNSISLQNHPRLPELTSHKPVLSTKIQQSDIPAVVNNSQISLNCPAEPIITLNSLFAEISNVTLNDILLNAGKNPLNECTSGYLEFEIPAVELTDVQKQTILIPTRIVTGPASEIRQNNTEGTLAEGTFVVDVQQFLNIIGFNIHSQDGLNYFSDQNNNGNSVGAQQPLHSLYQISGSNQVVKHEYFNEKASPGLEIPLVVPTGKDHESVQNDTDAIRNGMQLNQDAQKVFTVPEKIIIDYISKWLQTNINNDSDHYKYIDEQEGKKQINNTVSLDKPEHDVALPHVEYNSEIGGGHRIQIDTFNMQSLMAMLQEGKEQVTIYVADNEQLDGRSELKVRQSDVKQAVFRLMDDILINQNKSAENPENVSNKNSLIRLPLTLEITPFTKGEDSVENYTEKSDKETLPVKYSLFVESSAKTVSNSLGKTQNDNQLLDIIKYFEKEITREILNTVNNEENHNSLLNTSQKNATADGHDEHNQSFNTIMGNPSGSSQKTAVNIPVENELSNAVEAVKTKIIGCEINEPIKIEIPFTIELQLPEESAQNLQSNQKEALSFVHTFLSAQPQSITPVQMEIFKTLSNEVFEDIQQVNVLLPVEQIDENQPQRSVSSGRNIPQQAGNNSVQLTDIIEQPVQKAGSPGVTFTSVKEISTSDVVFKDDQIMITIDREQVYDLSESSSMRDVPEELETQKIHIILNKEILQNSLRSNSKELELTVVQKGAEEEPLKLRMTAEMAESLLKYGEPAEKANEQRPVFNGVIERTVENPLKKQDFETIMKQSDNRIRIRIPMTALRMSDVEYANEKTDIIKESYSRNNTYEITDENKNSAFKEAVDDESFIINQKLASRSTERVQKSGENQQIAPKTELKPQDTSKVQTQPNRIPVSIIENHVNDPAIKAQGMFVLRQSEHTGHVPEVQSNENISDKSSGIRSEVENNTFSGENSGESSNFRQQFSNKEKADIFSSIDKQFTKVHNNKVVSTEHVFKVEDTQIEMPRSEPSRQLWHAADLAENIVKQAVLSKKNGITEMKIQLVPPHLGRMVLRLKVVDNQLIARVQVETNEAKSLIQDNLPQLRDSIAERGIEIQKFDVDVRQNFHDQLNQPHWSDFEREQHRRHSDRIHSPDGSGQYQSSEEQLSGAPMRTFGYNTIELVA